MKKMKIDIITKEDLELFKQELLSEIRILVKHDPMKQWITSRELRELLSLSASSLQNLRNSSEIRGTKIGGKYYYKLSDIEDLFEEKL
jgi:hypothetical protein